MLISDVILARKKQDNGNARPFRIILLRENPFCTLQNLVDGLTGVDDLHGFRQNIILHFASEDPRLNTPS